MALYPAAQRTAGRLVGVFAMSPPARAVIVTHSRRFREPGAFRCLGAGLPGLDGARRSFSSPAHC